MRYPEIVFKALNRVHGVVLSLSKGKIGHKLYDMPVITLITRGRNTGKERQVLLTSPVQVGDSWVIIASKGGAMDHPQWYKNLLANPHVQAILPGSDQPQKFIARNATDEEYPQYWKQAVKVYPGYRKYQQKTERKIPVIVLDPEQ